MRKALILIFVFLSIGLFTRQSLWLDEATSAKAAGLGIYDLLTRYAPNDFHPPLYYLLLHFWIMIGGTDENWVRLLSVISVFFTTLFVYAIGRHFYGEKWGVVGAIIFGTGPLIFYYATEARMYALAMMWVALSVLGYIRFLSSGSWRWWVIWLLAMVFSIYTDYLPLLVQPIFFLMLFRIKTNRLKVMILTGFIVEILLFALWLPILIHQLVSGIMVETTFPLWWRILGQLSFKSLALLWVKMIIGRISFFDKSVYFAVVGFVSLIFGLALYKASKELKKVNLLWLWLLLPVTLGLILSLRLAIFQYFRFLFIAPAFYLLITVGIKNLGLKVAILFLSINLIFDAIYVLSPRFHREDWRSAADYIRTNKQGSSVALFPNSGQADAYLYYGSPAPLAESRIWYVNQPSQVWLFRYVQEIFDPDDTLKAQLEEMGYYKREEKSFNQILVWRYEKL
ncbi:MAG: hypothetical protein UW69_C0055G0002 [Microgenomates group bacterium GW2011_GWA2_44_7]|nr:MAG: hypothetical protein UW69_C0055G0002 [Microgenomates group bacterium GW2011_GWA2_44_7]KKT78370.1 MAG: hypothetical protein UW73_C0003G0018 [Microgenomates group bacterium GW2011_GWB1_44_8]